MKKKSVFKKNLAKILFENGQIDDAIISYDKAIKYLDIKYSSQAKLAFAAAILNLNSSDEDLLKLAIKNLEEAKI